MTGINGGQVTNAKLCLYNVDGANEGGDFYSVSDDSWQEETVTWNNAPAADTNLLASLGDVNANTWYEVDLTSHITSDGTYSLRVSDSVGGADYSSKEGANAPKLLVSVGGATPQSCTSTATATPTATPTLTNTPGPSPTPTNTSIPTATFTPGPTPIFSNAVFTYDGDGNLVKKIKPDGSKTIYVGGVYEVDKNSGGSVTGTVTYYPAAGAMRIDSTLYYVLKDQLGSASVVTDVSGVTVGEQRCYPFGETHFTNGTIHIGKLFTGQCEIGGASLS